MTDLPSANNPAFNQIVLESEPLLLSSNVEGLGQWDWNLQAGDVRWNLEEYRLFDLEPNSFGGTLQAWFKLIHPDDLERVQARVRQSLEGEVPYHDEFRVCPPRGGVRWVMGRGSLERDERGREVRMVGIHMNITERKEAERALLEREATLREVLEQQRRFVADASHELRAPLTAIQGNLELLRRYPAMPPSDRREALEDTEREARRLGRLVSDLLALARFEAGQSSKRDGVSLEEILEESALEHGSQAKLHTLKLSLPGSSTLESSASQPSVPQPSGAERRTVVQGDRERLKQLVGILLDNALKYTPVGGRITLELLRDPSGVRLEVKDNGIGISERDLPHVFERFYRADQARVRGVDPGGTGLGLSIARWITEQHGGQIALESQLGVGTTARVTLPIDGATE